MDTDVVILAGGLSSRAGGFKLELLIEGKPLLARVIEVFLPICTNIIIVGGYSIDRLYPLIKPYGNRVQLVWNKDYEKGMFTSVKTGIAEVKSPYFFLTPGDYPFLTTELCKELLKEIPGIVKPSTSNRGGHPLLLPRQAAEEILRLADSTNLQQYLHTKKVKRFLIEDEMLLLDIDTPGDYEKAKGKHTL
ncbi:MAG: nucleotidyltransferase family protein [Anaerocolumna sp.]|nr:nucleotidyltransferase family protein [Anaerocolumna sp.]